MSRFALAARLGVWLLLAAPLLAADPKQSVWTDPGDVTLPPDFRLQGEYAGEIPGDGPVGCQVIALAEGAFQAVVFQGGLPGAGWDGKSRSLLDGALTSDTDASFKPAAGTKKYLAALPSEFSATEKFPPEGQKSYTGTLAGGKFVGKNSAGDSFQLNRVIRVSPTMGVAAPSGAIVLFNGSNIDEWKGGRLDEKTHFLNTDGKDIVSKRKFTNYTMHLEFMLPYRPSGRGQGRGNSGFYQVDLYEMQILDSFGLEGKNNECGGIYTLAVPKVNMCLPPLAWQTYDVEFDSAKVDAEGKKTAPAIFTARHNGVLIHDKLALSGKTGGSRMEPEGTPGPIKLQGHGNPVQFRNVWLIER